MKDRLKLACAALVLSLGTSLARAEDMASMVSGYRHTHGLSAVKTDAQLTAVAERQAQAMARSGVMDHSVAGSFATRVSSTPVAAAGENLARGTKSWAETMQLWEASSGHNANLLLPGATIVGVGVATNERTHEVFHTLVIGRKLEKRALQPITAFHPTPLHPSPGVQNWL
jgi:uncharacterized protein YkwD